MRKFIILLVFLIAATLAMTYLYFSRLSEKDEENGLALRSATAHAALVFEFTGDRNFYKLISEQNLLSDFIGSERTATLNALASCMINDEDIYKLIAGSKIFCSIVPDSGKLELVLSAQTGDDKKASNLVAVLNAKKKLENLTNNLFRLRLDDTTFVFAGSREDLVVISPSKRAVMDRLALTTSASPEFEKYIKAADKPGKTRLMAMYINYNYMPELIRPLIVSNVDGELGKLNHQNSFAVLSYNFGKEKLLFNGTTVMNGKDNYYSLFANMEALPFSITSILPASTANYTAFTIDDYSRFLTGLDAHFKARNKTKQVGDALKKVQSSYLVDLRKSFTKYFDKQFITFQLNTGEQLGAIGLTDGSRIKLLLTDMSAPYDGEIAIFKERDILYTLFGDPLFKFSRPYYAVKGNYLIFANNASTIQSFIRSYEGDKLLVNDPLYGDFSNQFPENGNVSFYVNLKTSKDIFRQHLKFNYYKQYVANSGLGDYTSFCYQLTGDKGKFQTNMVIAKKRDVSADTLLTDK